MNVKQLKKFLEKYPDDMLLCYEEKEGKSQISWVGSYDDEIVFATGTTRPYRKHTCENCKCFSIESVYGVCDKKGVLNDVIKNCKEFEDAVYD